MMPRHLYLLRLQLLQAVKLAKVVKSFGSVAVPNGGPYAAKYYAVANRPATLSTSSTPSSQPAAADTSTHSVPKFDKKSIAKLFLSPSTPSVPCTPPEAPSPSSRSASLPSQAPRSPVCSPNTGPALTGLPSPRLTPAPGPPSGLPPPPSTMGPPHYYHPSFVSGVPPDQFYQQWPGHLLPLQHQHQPPQPHPQGSAPPSASLTISSGNPPMPLQQVPGTPTQSHALPPTIHHPPHPSAPQSLPPPTPATANRSTSLSANASAFVPTRKVISVRNASGQEVTFDALKRAPPAPVPPVPSSPVAVKKDIKRPIRIESQEQKERRLAEERAKKGESEGKIGSSDFLARANDVTTHHKIEEREEGCVRLEEEARAKRKAEKKAEKKRAKKERLRKLQEEEEACAEEAEQQRKEEEERPKVVEASENANAFPDDAEPASSPPEEGEVEEVSQSITTDIDEPTSAADKSSAASRPSSSLSPAELPIRPSADLQTTVNTNLTPPLPSALATARHIEDINRITYPQGIQSPKPELNVNIQKGIFCYDREFLLQFMNICKEKPDDLPPLDALGFKPSVTSHTTSRGGSDRNRSSNSLSMPSNTRSPSIGLGFLPSSMGSAAGSGFQMGQFSTSASKMSSEERYLASKAGRSVSVAGGLLDSHLPAMVSTIDQNRTGRERTRSKRGTNNSSRINVAGNAGPAAQISSMGPPTRPPPKAGDLSHFGKISKATPISFGPGSIFTSKKATDPKNRDPPISRTPSTSSNMFSMLQNPDTVVEPPTFKSSRSPSRKPVVDLASGTPSDPAPQRPKLRLLPRLRPMGSRVSTPAVSESGSEGEPPGQTGSPAPAMSEVDSEAKIQEDTKEFFSIRMLDEGETYFSSLPSEHRHLLVDALVNKSIEMKEPDVVLVSELFVRVRGKGLCNPADFEEGFNGLAELLDDLAVDIPKAWSYFATLLRGSGLHKDEERRGRIAEKTMDPNKLNRLL